MRRDIVWSNAGSDSIESPEPVEGGDDTFAQPKTSSPAVAVDASKFEFAAFQRKE